MVTLQVAELALVQPLHEENLLLPAVAAAVNVTAVPLLYVRVKLVVPFPELLLSAGLTVIATPLEGEAEFTVRT